MSLLVERLECPLTDHLVRLGVFRQEPLVVVDVGASGGVANVWNVFGDQWKAFGFEPLLKECERLIRESRSPNAEYVSAFVTGPPDTDCEAQTMASANRTMDWNYFRSSSVRAQKLQQIDYVRSHFNAGEEVVYTTRRTTLDDFFRARPETVNFIKIDTDGTDLDVLRGATELLKSPKLLGLVVESPFQGEFDNKQANVFANIDTFLRAQGFQVFDLTTWRYSRAALPSKFVYNIPAQTQRGPVTWGDALFFRDYGHPEYENLTAKIPDETDILKLAALFEVFDLEDCAADLLIKYKKQLAEKLEIEALLDLLVPTFDGRKMTYRQFVRYFDENVESFYPEPPATIEAKGASRAGADHAQNIPGPFAFRRAVMDLIRARLWPRLDALKQTWNAFYRAHK